MLTGLFRHLRGMKKTNMSSSSRLHRMLPLSQPLRQMSANKSMSAESFKTAYSALKSGPSGAAAANYQPFHDMPLVNRYGVFGNNNCSLKAIDAYGFDYDHTLANYNAKSGNIIYEQAINYLIQRENYPVELARACEFDEHFAIRGLTLDCVNGNVMKLNQFHKLNPRSIYNGHDPVDPTEIHDQYGGFRISEQYYKKNMKDIFDLFGVPETCLYCDIIHFFKSRKYDFEPEFIAADIQRAIDHVHDTGVFHKSVEQSPEEYVTKLPQFTDYVKYLRDGDKKLFLLTNSSFDFINNACNYLFEDVVKDLQLQHWTQVFNWTFVSAQKPKWFQLKQSASAKFRRLNRNELTGLSNAPFTLKPIEELQQHAVYVGGSLEEFHRLTRLDNDQVIYFGDNLGSDMMGPSKTGQWKTVAIIKELESEIDVNNHTPFKNDLAFLLDVEHLWYDAQHLKDLNDANIDIMLSDLSLQRDTYRNKVKTYYNQQFGSVFRTHSTRTLFFHRLARYSDLYTSKVTNMLAYPLYYKFGARRQFYDHENII